MKSSISKRNGLNIDRLITSIILSLIYASAWFDTIYERATEINGIYNRLYRYSIYLIVVVCIIKILLDVTRSHKLNSITVKMLLMFFYGAFITFVMDLFSFKSIIVDNLSWILSFCVFFSYGKEHQQNDRTIQWITIIGTAVYAVLMIPNLQRHILGYDLKGGIISPLYYSLGFLGIIFLICNNRVKTIFSGITGLMILFSTKRTGLFVFILGLLGYLYTSALIEKQVRQRIKKYGRIILILVVGMVVAFYAIERYNINILGRLATISTDGGSGRDFIWESVIERYMKADLFHKLFGYGFHAVPEIIRPYNRYLFAHNGFLEVLFDFGVIGLAGMIAGILWLSSCTFKMIKKKKQYAPVMVFAMCIIVLFSISAYFFEEARFVMPVTFICGICTGRLKDKRSAIKQ